MRCLALAQGWQDSGGGAVFVTRGLPAALRERLQAEGIDIVQLVGDASEHGEKETVATARRWGADWVVVDGYRLTHQWQHAVRDSGCRVLAFDDNGQIGHHCADLVVDQNLETTADFYADWAADCRLLLGPRCVLLRREFRRWQEWRRECSPAARRILVTLGGADPGNATARIVRALDRIGRHDLEAVVLVGPANPHRAELEAALRQTRGSIDLREPVADIAEWMAWADLAIAAGGTTCWELAFMGLPSLLFVLANNQAGVARAAERAGFARNLGKTEDLSDSTVSNLIEELLADAPLRSRMADRGRECVDGEGVERVLMHLRGDRLRLRIVRASDAELLWRWANDPGVRRASLSQRPISWEEHLGWFEQKQRESGCLMYVGLDENDEPVGQVRVDGAVAEDAEIHVSVVAERRGAGWGERLIRQAVECATRERRLRQVRAVIKENNLGSLRVFEKAGFCRVASETWQGERVVRAVYSCGESAR
jgi:UDP-2,4-diacetamido-2,4,6-trideoxy-beta-L-altropyranose hydrolase